MSAFDQAIPSGAMRGKDYQIELTGGPMDGDRLDVRPEHPLPSMDPKPYLAITVGCWCSSCEHGGMYRLAGLGPSGDSMIYVWSHDV